MARYAAYFGIATLGCVVDLWSKHAIFEWRGMPGVNGVYWLVDGYFGIETALNNGAVFGSFQGGTPVFAGLSFVAGIAITVWFCRVAWRDRLLTLALGMILGGIGGNLYDRLGLWTPPGFPDARITQVRDWILMCWGPENVWPNYNIADCLLVCGAGLLMVHICFFDGGSKPKPKEAEAKTSDDDDGEPHEPEDGSEVDLETPERTAS